MRNPCVNRYYARAAAYKPHHLLQRSIASNNRHMLQVVCYSKSLRFVARAAADQYLDCRHDAPEFLYQRASFFWTEAAACIARKGMHYKIGAFDNCEFFPRIYTIWLNDMRVLDWHQESCSSQCFTLVFSYGRLAPYR